MGVGPIWEETKSGRPGTGRGDKPETRERGTTEWTGRQEKREPVPHQTREGEGRGVRWPRKEATRQAPPTVPPGEFGQLFPAPLALCEIREMHILGISFCLPKALRVSSQASPSPWTLIQPNTDGSDHDVEPAGGHRSPWLEFFLIPPCPLSLKQ